MGFLQPTRDIIIPDMKIPKHVWYWVVLPLALLSLAVWRLWPYVEEYRAAKEDDAAAALNTLMYTTNCNLCGGLDYTVGEDLGTDVSGYRLTPLARNDSSEIELARQAALTFCGGPHEYAVKGFCAYPATYDWRHRKTLIINQEGWVYTTNNGGQPISKWPNDREFSEQYILHWPH